MMKQIQKTSLLFLGTMLLLVIVTCKKPEDKFFNGNYHVRGTIYFTNLLTNNQDTASNARLVLYKKGADTSINYVNQLTNGTYDFSNLTAGPFIFNIKFSYKYPGAAKSTTYSLNQEFSFTQQFQDHVNFTVAMDSTATPTLRITVADANGLPISNASVCLYSDTIALVANQHTCTGSLKTGVSNQAGVILFDNLQVSKNYFASAYAPIGSDTLANYTSYIQALTLTQKNKVNPAGITLTQVSTYALQLLITDQYNALVPAVNVCLYSDPALLAKYRGKCTGSLRSGMSNASGTILFNKLQNLTYYVSAYTVYGTDSLTNAKTDLTPITPGKLNQLTPVKIVIKK